MEYRIAGPQKGTSDFEEEVNRLIKDGWSPQGGLCVAVVGDYDCYYTQAMIKE
jgi:hypothetical protein